MEPSALFEHCRDFVLHTQPHALEIDVDDPVPVLLAAVQDGRIRGFDAGVVVGDVQPAVFGDDQANHLFDVARLGYVGLDKERFAAGVADEARRFKAALAVHVTRDNFGPCLREGQRRSPANAGTRSRNQRHLIRQRCVFKHR